MWASFCLIAISSAAGALCASVPHKRATLVTPQVVHTFPNGTNMENLAVRASGQILCTIITAPDLYQVNPSVNSSATLVHSFSGYETLFGIAEVQPDQFYVLAGNASAATLTSVEGSWSAFHVDMTSFESSGAATIDKVADFPDALLLNGMGLLNLEEGLVYVADPYAGAISILNVNTGAHYVAINNSLTIPAAPFTTPLGVNGVHVFQEPDGPLYVYFSNTAQSLLARMPIDATGTPIGDAEVVASGIMADDFTFDSDGNVLQAVIGSDEIVKIDPSTGTVTVIAGSPNNTELRSVSAAQFGRLSNETTTLFVTLNGGNLGAGGPVVPGAVKMLDLGVVLA
ncbi:quinoprotein amine dehydrogenase beta chain-like protein [Lentinula edodes]|uniref:Quinoprotein amine dehydrogenase beta chain-like protein n=1 Tax=Lentinula edodes TaxID=5353 RepID=A0A1Q3E785_LENED|nr:uncharacterized protein C8R40DRAFT_1166301 [Lentinula edodes]KAF8823676.1 hypothetical protein HHX47_DHR9000005 [Lentinula edodes]KAH7880102.1 hypothetical protein C8R40DRAFT_1166301 [Lentinula edodes]GAW03041.1 quinoprotein amine dehydrogenase beta chain-like protein [Lentinula edodes]